MTVPLFVFVFDSRERWFPVGVGESLEPFGYAWRERGWPDTRQRLDFPSGMRQPDLPPVAYHEQMEGGPLWWHRIHLWSLYNPGPPIFQGQGRHEGDWEMVQVGRTESGIDAQGEPVLVTLSQHAQGGKREWWACEVGKKDGRPFIRVYVALGSHAMYFTPGRHGADVCDGKGRHVTPELREPGPWWRWQGRWGNSEGSPKSPGNQRGEPHVFHMKAKGS